MVKVKEVEPEDLAEVMDLAAEPLSTIAAAARECGLDEKVARSLIKAVNQQYAPVMQEMRTVKTGELQRMIDDRAWRALAHMTDKKFSEASAVQLAVMMGILLEKRQLLRGEPTHIFSIGERESLNDLIPMMVKEAHRRGMEISQEGEMIDITPGPEERAYRPRTGRIGNLMKKIRADQKVELGEP